jgi:Phosphotransferase enzyme family
MRALAFPLPPIRFTRIRPSRRRGSRRCCHLIARMRKVRPGRTMNVSPSRQAASRLEDGRVGGCAVLEDQAVLKGGRCGLRSGCPSGAADTRLARGNLLRVSGYGCTHDVGKRRHDGAFWLRRSPSRRPGVRAALVTRVRVPEGPEDLTPAWLTTVLRESGVLSSGRVESADCERIGQDFGFASFVGRIRLRYVNASGDAPSTVIVKLPTAPDAAAYERCAREERFYREMGGEFAPSLYYSMADAEAQRVVLLLEDLSAGRQGDVLHGCSIEEAALVIGCIAPFHARWWEAGAPIDVFPRCSGEEQARQERYDVRAGAFLEQYGESVPPLVRDLVQRLRSRLAQVRIELAEGPRTLIHADLHLDNIVFDARRGRSVAILDWQTACIGAPAWDVALFLCGSLGVEDRRAAEASLLERYATLLAANGAGDYAVDGLWRDYRLALLSLLAGTVGWLASVDATGRARELQRAVFDDGRLFAALLDHDVAAVIG